VRGWRAPRLLLQVLQARSIRQHTSAYVSICHTECSAAAVAGVAGEKHTSAYVSIRHTHTECSAAAVAGVASKRQSNYASIRQHTSAYVSIRQHTSSAAAVAGVASEKQRGARCLLKDICDAETYADICGHMSVPI
jgi:hypothetical protein